MPFLTARPEALPMAGRRMTGMACGLSSHHALPLLAATHLSVSTPSRPADSRAAAVHELVAAASCAIGGYAAAEIDITFAWRRGGGRP